MRRFSTNVQALGFVIVSATSAGGQAPPAVAPPIRNLGPVDGKMDSVFTTVSTVRTLSSGKLLVLDVRGQQVLLVDADLKKWKVVADTSVATSAAYAGNGGLIPYHGDTTLFVDTRNVSFVVIDPQGKLGRVIAIPRPNDAFSLTGGATGFAGFDANGRLVYRGRPGIPQPSGVGKDGFMEIPALPDIYPLWRVDMERRTLDTVAQLKVPQMQMAFFRRPDGVAGITTALNPLPLADDWALLKDGTIAVVRVVDYHVDWIKSDGTVTSGPRIPFEWQHFDDAQKVAFVDSTKAAMEKLNPTREYRIATANERAPAEMFGLTATGQPIQRPVSSDGRAAPVGGVEAARKDDGGGGRPAAVTQTPPPPPPQYIMAPEKLPDYAPPFAPGATRVDVDGNLWIRTSVTIGGSPLYHVINGKGLLVDRILVPAGRVISGFGPNGVVYMGVRDGAGTRLERARLFPKS